MGGDGRTYGVTMRGEGLSCYVQLKSMIFVFYISIHYTDQISKSRAGADLVNSIRKNF